MVLVFIGFGLLAGNASATGPPDLEKNIDLATQTNDKCQPKVVLVLVPYGLDDGKETDEGKQLNPTPIDSIQTCTDCHKGVYLNPMLTNRPINEGVPAKVKITQKQTGIALPGNGPQNALASKGEHVLKMPTLVANKSEKVGHHPLE